MNAEQKVYLVLCYDCDDTYIVYASMDKSKAAESKSLLKNGHLRTFELIEVPLEKECFI